MRELETGSTGGGRRRGVAGVVLAGGRSTRFDGADKALATVDGEPMLARVVRALAPVTDAVVVNCRADQRDPFERALADVDVDGSRLQFAVDDRPDEGPLVGLDRALDEVDAPLVLVAACDLPWVTEAVFDALVAPLREPGGELEAVVPVDDAGFPKPTCAAYRTGALASAVAATVASGSRRLADVLDALRVREVQSSDLGASRALRDVDSRADLPGAEPVDPESDQ